MSDNEPDTPITSATETPVKETPAKQPIYPSKMISIPKEQPKAAPQVTSNVAKLNTLTKAFEDAFNSKEDTITALINIVNYLNRSNDPKVFSAFTGWFASHLDDCMNPQVALRGIHTVQNKRIKTRVPATHQCFEELVRVLKSRPRSHYRFTLKAMQAMEISETLGKWILKRAQE